MATQAQMEANRRNAQKSTGPTTEYGKQAAKFNALKHGMTAKTSVLPYEDKLAFEELREAFMSEYDPANSIEASLVETIVNSYWRLLRARRVETASYHLHMRTLKGKHKISEKPDPKKDDQAIAVIFSRDDGYDPPRPLGNASRALLLQSHRHPPQSPKAASSRRAYPARRRTVPGTP